MTDAEVRASPDETEEEKRKREITEQSRQLQAKYGVSQPKKSDLLQRHMARGGRQYWDSGEYNKSDKKAKEILSRTSPAVTPGRTSAPAPLVRKLSGGQSNLVSTTLPPSPTSTSPPSVQVDLV